MSEYYWRYSNFNDWLQVEKFHKQNPGVLDDGWPEAYDDWLMEQDITDIVRWGDEYHAYQVAREKQEANKGENTDA